MINRFHHDTEPPKKYHFYLIPVTVLVIIVMFILITKCDFTHFNDVLTTTNGFFLVAGAFFAVAQIVLEGNCYRITLMLFGTDISRKNGFLYACQDLFYCSITPFACGGMPMTAYMMKKDGINSSDSCATLLMFSTLNKFAVSFIAILSIFFFKVYDIALSIPLLLMFITGIVVNVFLCIVCLMTLFMPKNTRAAGIKLIHLGAKLRIIKNTDNLCSKLEDWIFNFQTAVSIIKKHKMTSAILSILCLLKRASMVMVCVCVFLSLGSFDVSLGKLFVVHTVFLISSDSVQLPGTIGSAEAAFSLACSDLYGASHTVPAILLTRGLNFYFIVLFTGAVIAINSIRTKRVIHAEVYNENYTG